ncbi:MAG: AEC family transporter, partial [bacterium]
MISLQIEIFILVAIGYILSKVGIFTKHTRKHLTDMILTVILPAATINSFLIQLTPEIIQTTLIVLIISASMMIFYMFINLFLYRHASPDHQVNLKYGTLVSNCGFMGMPISEAMYGPTGLLYACIYLIPQRIAMWSFGLSMYSVANLKTVVKKVVLHPCLIGIYIGVVMMIMMFFGIKFPVFLTRTISAVGSCNTALSMFVIGGILSEVNPRSIFDQECLYYAVIRLLAIPLVVFVALRWMPIEPLAKKVCVILTGMPAATTTGMLAAKYERDPQFASKMI